MTLLLSDDLLFTAITRSRRPGSSSSTHLIGGVNEDPPLLFHHQVLVCSTAKQNVIIPTRPRALSQYLFSNFIPSHMHTSTFTTLQLSRSHRRIISYSLWRSHLFIVGVEGYYGGRTVHRLGEAFAIYRNPYIARKMQKETVLVYLPLLPWNSLRSCYSLYI